MLSITPDLFVKALKITIFREESENCEYNKFCTYKEITGGASYFKANAVLVAGGCSVVL